MSQEKRLGAMAIGRWPLLLGVLTGIGLVAALFSDGGWGDTVANACLAMPVVVALWFGWLHRLVRPRPPG